MESVGLRNIIKYAAEHVAYYRDSFGSCECDIEKIGSGEELAVLPLLDKDKLQSNHDSFVSDEYQAFPKFENIIVKNAIGNDGRLFKIYSDKNALEKKEDAMNKLRKELYGIDENDRKCSFYKVQYLGNKLRSIDECRDERTKNSINFFILGMTKERIMNIYDTISEFRPKFMEIKPSIAMLMADVMEKEGLKPFSGLEYIEFKDEYISVEGKQRLEKIFGAKSIRTYGCEEADKIAYEYPDGKLHILSDNVLVEAIKDQKSVYDEEGDIVITTLDECSMPLIRYSMGVRGIVSRNDMNEEILEITKPKDNDYITLENNEKLPSESIALLIEHTNSSMSRSIKQFRIIQNGINDFTVKMAILPSFKGWKKAVEESFVSNIREPLLKNAKWNFEWEDEIDYNSERNEKSFYINCIGA